MQFSVLLILICSFDSLPDVKLLEVGYISPAGIIPGNKEALGKCLSTGIKHAVTEHDTN